MIIVVMIIVVVVATLIIMIIISGCNPPHVMTSVTDIISAPASDADGMPTPIDLQPAAVRAAKPKAPTKAAAVRPKTGSAAPVGAIKSKKSAAQGTKSKSQFTGQPLPVMLPPAAGHDAPVIVHNIQDTEKLKLALSSLPPDVIDRYDVDIIIINNNSAVCIPHDVKYSECVQKLPTVDLFPDMPKKKTKKKVKEAKK